MEQAHADAARADRAETPRTSAVRHAGPIMINVKTFDQWLLFVFAATLSVNAVRDYVGEHWWWAAAETAVAILTWWLLGRFRRSLYGSPWPKLR